MHNSKEDEEILKAEYERNPKPDKAARMEIVSKVALGEKEVQVCQMCHLTRCAELIPNNHLRYGSRTGGSQIVGGIVLQSTTRARLQAHFCPHLSCPTLRSRMTMMMM